MRTSALFTLATLLILPMTASAEMYSWKDASGKTIYSDKPPIDKKITARELKPVKASSGHAATSPAKGSDAAAQGNDGDAAKGPGKTPEQLKAEADARQQLCDNAQKRLVQLESEKGILLSKNEKGESVPLVGDARKAELESARKDATTWCK